MIFRFAAELEEPKIGVSGKGLRQRINSLPNDKILALKYQIGSICRRQISCD